MTPRRAVWIVLSGLALACAPAQERREGPPDVLLLVVDGLRADEVDGWIETAGLDGWLSGEGVARYPRAYAPSSLGVQSLAALFAGRLPTHGGGIGLAEAQPSERATTLATEMRRAGYRTGLISQAPWAARPGFARGFDDLQVAPAAGWSAAEVTTRALRVVDDWGASAVPEEARPRFLVGHWTPVELDGAGAASGSELAAALESAGSALAALREGLAARDAFTGAAVALTAGHGLERGEHGGTGAGWTLHEEAIRVPLVVRGLGSGDRTASAAPVSTIALGTTLRELASAAGEVGGGAAIPALSHVASPDASSRPAPVISELVVRERAIARAVIDGEVKYLRVVREVPPADRQVVARGYEELQAAMLSGQIPTPPLFGEPVRELLVRVTAEGVGEIELVLTDHREELSRLRAVLRDYRRLCEEDGWAPPEITERLPVDLEDVEQLEMLGYL